MTAMPGLEGKRFLVLGGGLGMGEATSRLLAASGAHIAIVDRDAERAERVAAEVGRDGVTARPYAVDVTDDAALVELVAKVERELGPLNGLATVIGMAAWSSLLDLEMATWDSDQRRNVRYFFLAAREVARGLLARGAPGSIVAVGSVDGIRSAPGHAAYGVAKAGLINLAKTMAVEWSGGGVRVNIVAPGGIVTPRVPHSGDANEAKMMAGVPMRRRGTVEEVANAIGFLLSDLSSYVTGQTLAVDGGFEAATAFNIVLPAKPQGVIGDADA